MTHLDTDPRLEDGGAEEKHPGPALVQLAHLHRPAERLAALVHVLRQQHLVVGVNPRLRNEKSQQGNTNSQYLNTAVQDEFHQFVFQVGHGGVEADGHPAEIGRTVGGEVLDEAAVADHGEESVEVGGEIHVQQQVVLHIM